MSIRGYAMNAWLYLMLDSITWNQPKKNAALGEGVGGAGLGVRGNIDAQVAEVLGVAAMGLQIVGKP
jgi:hypothetical protein